MGVFYPVVVQETTVEWVLGDTSHHQHDGAQPRRVYDWVDRGAREAGVVYVV